MLGRSDVVEGNGSASEVRLREIAQQAVDPCVTSSAVVAAFGGGMSGGAIDRQAIYEAVRAQALDARDGGFAAADATLVGQAIALNVIFATMARRGQAALRRPGAAGERSLRLAMRAQAQCRATLHALHGLADRPRKAADVEAQPYTVIERAIVEPPRCDADGNIIPWPEEAKADEQPARDSERVAYGEG